MNKNIKKRLLFYFLAVVFSLLVSFLPQIYEIIEPYRLIWLIEKELSDVVGNDVHVMNLSLNLKDGFTIEAKCILVVDEERKMLARVDEMVLGIDLKEALRKRIKIDKAKLNGVTAHIRVKKNKNGGKKWEEIEQKLEEILSRVKAESVELENVSLVVMEEGVEDLRDGYAVLMKRVDISIGDSRVIVSMSGEVTLPWYEKSIKFAGRFTSLLKSALSSVKAECTVKAPSLLLRNEWNEKENSFPQTEGEIDFEIDGSWDGKSADVKALISAGNVKMKMQGKEGEFENLITEVSVLFKGRTISIGIKTSSDKVGLKQNDQNAQLDNFNIIAGISYDGKTLKAKTSTSSNKVKIKNKKHEYSGENVFATAELSFDENMVRVEKAELGLGADGKETTLSIKKSVCIFEGALASGEKKINVEKLETSFTFVSKDMKAFGKNTGIKNWPLGGELKADVIIFAENDIATGEVRFSGRKVKLNIPKLYGRKPPTINEIEVRGNFEVNSSLVELKDFRVKSGRSSAQINGRLELEGNKPKKIVMNVYAPYFSYNVVRPLLPRNRMKTGSREFFFGDLKNAEVRNVKGIFKWADKWKNKKKKIVEKLEATGEIENALIDLGGSEVKADKGKVSLKNGKLTFDKLHVRAAGSELNSPIVEITDLAENPRLKIHLNETVKAESLVEILSAQRINLGDFIKDVHMSGLLHPQMILDIPLKKKGNSFSMKGNVELEKTNISVAGLLPLMEGMAGSVRFDGRKIKTDMVEFIVGKMRIKAIASMDDFLKPAAEVKIFSPRLLPKKFIDGIAPKPEERKSGGGEGVRIELVIKTPSGQFKTLHFSDLKTTLTLVNDRVQIKKLRMSFAGGDFELDGPAAVFYSGLWAKFHFKAKKMDPYELLKIFGIRQEVVKGKLQMKGNLKVKGFEYEDIKSTLAGRIHFKIKKGSIEQSNILLKVFNMINVDFSKGKTRGFGYRHIEGDIKSVDGFINIENITINGFFMRIVATGWIDLDKGKMEIDMGLVPLGSVEKSLGKIKYLGHIIRSKEGKTLLGYYFRLKGPIDDYRIVQLGPEGVKEKLKSLIKQIVGEVSEEKKENRVEEEKKSKLSKILKGLVKPTDEEKPRKKKKKKIKNIIKQLELENR